MNCTVSSQRVELALTVAAFIDWHQTSAVKYVDENWPRGQCMLIATIEASTLKDFEKE